MNKRRRAAMGIVRDVVQRLICFELKLIGQSASCQKRTNTVWCSFTVSQKIFKITEEKNSNYSELISNNR